MNALEFRRKALGHTLRWSDRGTDGTGTGNANTGGADSGGMGGDSSGGGSGWGGSSTSTTSVGDYGFSGTTAGLKADSAGLANTGLGFSAADAGVAPGYGGYVSQPDSYSFSQPASFGDVSALNEAGYGSMTGLNPNNPTQSVGELMASNFTNKSVMPAVAGLITSAVPGGSLMMGGLKAAQTGNWGGFAGGLVGGATGMPMGSQFGSLAGTSLQTGQMPSAAQVGGMVGGYALGQAGAKVGADALGQFGAVAGGMVGSKVGSSLGASLGNSMAPGTSNTAGMTPGAVGGVGSTAGTSGQAKGDGTGLSMLGQVNTPSAPQATPQEAVVSKTPSSIAGLSSSLFSDLDAPGWAKAIDTYKTK